ncbi:MAG: hypothetical protein KDB68_09770 [Planctomycetes bacterium]|nr:hypothetical protein [Planctomycetota bacterium]
MKQPYRFRIASFDTDIPPGPLADSGLPAGEEIADNLREVLLYLGYTITEFDLLESYAWWITLKVGQSTVDVELFGASEDWPWMVFIRSSAGCLFFFRTKPDDLAEAYRVVDDALRQVSLVRNVRWHEEGAHMGELGDSRPHPE